ncbi:MAG: hypothetical protein ACUVTZ_12290 [Armatimonadota bacterium]
MEIKPSDKLRLRVDAISLRLREISDEVARSKSEAYDLQRRIEELTVAALVEGDGERQLELDNLRNQLVASQERAAQAEQDEARLKDILATARREYLDQLRRERRGRWMVLE